MQLYLSLNQNDVIAALQAFVASNGHEMNATVNPTFSGDGSVTVELNK
jgi:hypothetical protein